MFSESELNTLYRYSLTLTSDETKAFDLLQDGLERYLKKQAEQTIEKPLNYIRRIIRNRFIDTLRQEKANPLVSVENTDDFQIQEISFKTLENIQITQQTLENIWIKIQPLERELLHLWAVEQWTAQEISEQLEISRGTVLSRIHRLRKKIMNFDLDRKTTNQGGSIT